MARHFTEEEVQRLIELYTSAEASITARLLEGFLRGRQTAYLEAMRQNIQNILDDLLGGSRTWCEESIPRLYSEHVGEVDADVRTRGLKTKVVAGFGDVHQQAVQVLAENTFNRFTDVTQFIGRRTDDIYRHLALESIRGTVIGYDTWKGAMKNYRNQLADRGVTGFQDKSGRNWNMRTYSEMVARTSTMECHLQGTGNRILELGYDLVVVSYHKGACEKCIPWEKKVLSLTGKTEGYPTLDEAKEDGLFHPNCAHTFSLWAEQVERELEDLRREEEALRKT